MRVRIVSYEDVNAWILGKFARKLNEELIQLGVNSDIAKVQDPLADFNHHIIYTQAEVPKLSRRDTLMVTHVDETGKVELLKKQLVHASAAICMSKATMTELASVGVPKERLCYVSPAHDDVMRPRPLVIGITSKIQPTGSKREDMVSQLSKHINPSLFEFVIMGAGWERMIREIRANGVKVTYYDEFDYDKYVEIMPTFDYYLYPGQDEGSMGFIDALAAGVMTVVTPQGFHLDAERAISYPFNTTEELIDTFERISAERSARVNAVARWTWKDYAIKHLEIWNHLSGSQNTSAGNYVDGLASLVGDKDFTGIDVEQYKKELSKGTVRRFTYMNLNRLRKLTNPVWVWKRLRSMVKSTR